eukprot:TRINITY_DN6674_c0_g1_i1.p1 TRINITY_DN6674_c0_g1~~TRINITY_DN6674_c0_g1_i1.p1  ORF type:complete len:203 (+),score=50.96 TRINITY_DN6674_c0_g1_i1:41-610(+)
MGNPVVQVVGLSVLTAAFGTITQWAMRQIPHDLLWLGSINPMKLLDGEMSLGRTFGYEGYRAYEVGVAFHFLVSIIFTTLYVIAFEIRGKATPRSGVYLSLVHLLIGGIAMGFTPQVHDYFTSSSSSSSPTTFLEHPGFFTVNNGPWPVSAFIVYHLLYGYILGSLYEVQSTSSSSSSNANKTSKKKNI